MRLIKPLATLLLGLLAFTLFIIGIFVGGWFSVPIYIVACIAIHLIDGMYRRASTNDWASYGGPGFLIAIFLAGFLHNTNPANEKYLNAPTFKDLEVSTGTLKNGLDRDIYITKKDGTDLILLCADNSGKYMTQTCVPDEIHYAYGKNVTVYHEHPFRISRMEAFFYEIRYKDSPLVRYEDVLDSLKRRRLSENRSSKNLMIMLGTLALYSLFYILTKRRQYKASITSNF